MTPLPSGPFDVIVVDPPWSYGQVNDRSSADKHYETATTTGRGRDKASVVDEIVAEAPVGTVAAPVAALYLWVTNPKLRIGFDLMDAYGFAYKTTVTWVKITKAGNPRPGMGFFYRGATEHVLLGTRGGYAIPPALRVPNVVLAQRDRHSAKPREFYEMVKRSSPGQRRLDVFARTERPGWDVWGNEIGTVPRAGAVARAGHYMIAELDWLDSDA